MNLMKFSMIFLKRMNFNFQWYTNHLSLSGYFQWKFRKALWLIGFCWAHSHCIAPIFIATDKAEGGWWGHLDPRTAFLYILQNAKHWRCGFEVVGSTDFVGGIYPWGIVVYSSCVKKLPYVWLATLRLIATSSYGPGWEWGQGYSERKLSERKVLKLITIYQRTFVRFREVTPAPLSVVDHFSDHPLITAKTYDYQTPLGPIHDPS